jgi:hypothetical protein
VTTRTLVWWRAELARRARDGAGAGRGPRLLPVVVDGRRDGRAAEGGGLEVVVEFGTARMSLRGAVTGEHLEAIVGRLAASC